MSHPGYVQLYTLFRGRAFQFADPTGLQVFAAERHLMVAVGFSPRSRNRDTRLVAERQLMG